MIIVVEGIRKAGKTSFIEEVQLNIGEQAPVFRFYDRELQTYNVNQQEANFVSCMQFAKAAIEVDAKLKALHQEPLIFFDRFHISELIFGRAYRNYNSSEYMTKVDKFLAENNAKLLLCLSDTSSSRTDDELFTADFVKCFDASFIKDKFILNLDKEAGMVTEDVLNDVLTMLGFYQGEQS